MRQHDRLPMIPPIVAIRRSAEHGHIHGFSGDRAGVGCHGCHAHQGRAQPTVQEAGRFHAVPETVTGQKLKLLVDTGGGGAGLYWGNWSATNRLRLRTGNCTVVATPPPAP